MEDPQRTAPPPDDDPHRTEAPPEAKKRKQTRKRRRQPVDPVAETASLAGGRPPVHAQETLDDARQDLIAGRYRLERELARGGMGVVHVGWDTQVERPVAIKQLLAARGASPEEVERFRREGRAVAKLQHPRIVRVYELVEQDGVLNLVMELVDGESAMDRLRREELLDVEQAVRIGIGVAEALQAAHEEGIAHRDVKPHNVLLTREGAVKLTDFGIAKVTRLVDLETPADQVEAVLQERRSLTADGAVMGTPSYMSPEQVMGDKRRIDHRSDVYSLGATLYELLTGQVPFEAKTLPTLLARILEEEPRPPSAIRAGVSPQLDQVVLRCLEKDPLVRFPDASDVAAALNGCLFSLVPEKAPLREVIYGERRTDRSATLKSLGIVGAAFLGLPLVCVVSALISPSKPPRIVGGGGKRTVKPETLHERTLGLRAKPGDERAFELAEVALVEAAWIESVQAARGLYRRDSQLEAPLAEALRLRPRGPDAAGEDVRYPSAETLAERAAAIEAAWERVFGVDSGRMHLPDQGGFVQLRDPAAFRADARKGRWVWVPVERGDLCPWAWVLPEDAERLLRASLRALDPSEASIRVYEVPLTGHPLRVQGEGLVHSLIGRRNEKLRHGRTHVVRTVPGSYGFELTNTRRGVLLCLWPKGEGRGWLALMDLKRAPGEESKASFARVCRAVNEWKGELSPVR